MSRHLNFARHHGWGTLTASCPRWYIINVFCICFSSAFGNMEESLCLGRQMCTGDCIRFLTMKPQVMHLASGLKSWPLIASPVLSSPTSTKPDASGWGGDLSQAGLWVAGTIRLSLLFRSATESEQKNQPFFYTSEILEPLDFVS